MTVSSFAEILFVGDWLLPKDPHLRVETVTDFGLTDIAAERYHASIRLGEQITKDMIPVRIGPDLHMAAEAAPSYFEGRKRLKKSQDLTEDMCINLRLPTCGGLYAWEFEKNGRALHVRLEG